MSAELLVALGLLAGAASGQGPAGRLRDVMAEPAEAGDVRRPARPGARARSRLRRRASMSAAAVDVPFALALELRAGRGLGPALEAVSLEQQGFPELSTRLRHAAAVATSGGDVGAALAAGAAGGRDLVAASLRATAACCGSAQSAGLPLGDLLDAAGSAARAGLSLAGMARAELAGARSTAMVLAALPLAGVAMGQALGARPVEVLFGTGWGAGCLTGALGLTVAGLLWTKAITAGLRRALL
jgi:tight adherence protein B